ncbi:MAG: MlaE family lipid ABC transporter permease subunit [Planctomycetes bacterium]|nr:MlaE family lipid ABC transporter permease subunit [Planctomycetota bacterium]
MDTHADTYSLERRTGEDDATTIVVGGVVGLREAVRFVSELRAQVAGSPGRVVFDLAGLEEIDTAALALLLHEGRRLSPPAELRGARGRVADVLTLYREAPRGSLRECPTGKPVFVQVGEVVEGLWERWLRTLSYVGECTAAVGATLRRPQSVPWRDVVRIMERAGADGLPIVVLISFLIGLIMAFQSAVQLQQFGADVFVADLVGLVVTRELGPLMTAIVVAGRSGAAFSAELGTMTVSEEVDALHTIGLNPFRFLVVPRVLALVLVLPLMTLIADLTGVLGGLLTGVGILDLTPRAYLIETRLALEPWDVFSGVFKSLFFAMAIALIACERGLSTKGGADGVGRATTSAVVTTLFTLVALDAVFTVIFHLYGI